jgi:hypothetical protein
MGVVTSQDISTNTDYILTALAKLKASFHTGTLTSDEVTQIKAAITYGYNQGLISYANKGYADAVADTLLSLE